MSGAATWELFADRADVGVATIYRLLGEDPFATNVSLPIRNQVARALGFSDWWVFVDGWKRDDLSIRGALTHSTPASFQAVIEMSDEELKQALAARTAAKKKQK